MAEQRSVRRDSMVAERGLDMVGRLAGGGGMESGFFEGKSGGKYVEKLPFSLGTGVSLAKIKFVKSNTFPGGADGRIQAIKLTQYHVPRTY